MVVDVLQAAVSILVGCLIGTLAYLVPAALTLGRPTMAAPRAVVRVPERVCHSIRCRFSGTTEHLVEVEVLEKTPRYMKVKWPRRFRHLDAWIHVADAPGTSLPVPNVRLLEELPAQTLWSSSEFEQWLYAVGAKLDALDEAPVDARVDAHLIQPLLESRE